MPYGCITKTMPTQSKEAALIARPFGSPPHCEQALGPPERRARLAKFLCGYRENEIGAIDMRDGIQLVFRENAVALNVESLFVTVGRKRRRNSCCAPGTGAAPFIFTTRLYMDPCGSGRV